MERYLSVEDRIRRAEEIYQRRNNLNVEKTAKVNLFPKKEFKLFRKIAFQVLACFGIYFGIYGMQSNTDKISIHSLKYIKNTLAYDIDFNKWINTAQKHIQKIYSNIENLENNKNQEEQKEKEQVQIEDNNKNEEVEIKEDSNEAEEKEETTNIAQETSSKSQMEQDAEYIKNNFSLIKPVIGTITSRFGPRNPTTPTVPKYHTGIDIAVNEGTVFIASMDGIVEKVSSEGDYRKPRKNNKSGCNDSLCTLQNYLC